MSDVMRSKEPPKVGDDLNFAQITMRGGAWDTLPADASLWLQAMYKRKDEIKEIKLTSSENPNHNKLYVRIFKKTNGEKRAHVLVARNEQAILDARPREIAWDGFRQEVRISCGASLSGEAAEGREPFLRVIEDPTISLKSTE